MTLVVSFGAGKNSTALLIAMWLKGIVPDAIIFADTGNERAQTYEHIEKMQEWLKQKSFPEISIIQYHLQKRKSATAFYPAIKNAKNIGYWLIHNLISCLADYLVQNYRYESLGEQIILFHGLPGEAYGSPTCSVKWKINPIKKWLKENYPDGGITAVGYHADEGRRLLDKSGKQRSLDNGNGFQRWYPLMEWGMNEKDCQLLCQAELGYIPIKSSCWFCPNARPYELEGYPQEIVEIGQDMEVLAEYGNSIKGRKSSAKLGRNFSWREIEELPGYRKAEPPKPCSCYDAGLQYGDGNSGDGDGDGSE